MEDNILLLTKQALGDEFARLAGHLLGESESSMQSALGALLPGVVGGLALSSALPGGAARLLSLLQGPAIDADVLDSICECFGVKGARAVALMRTGANLVPDLFGSTGGALAGSLTVASRLKVSTATNLLALTVPLVMAVLKKIAAENHLDARGLASVLGRQGPHLLRALDHRVANALGFASPEAFAAGLSVQAREAALAVAAAPPTTAPSPPPHAPGVVLDGKSGVARVLPWMLTAVTVGLVPLLWRTCST
jgi:hypothetical protein